MSHLFVRTMAAAALRKSGKSKATSSNRCWSPNTGEVTEDGVRCRARIAVIREQPRTASTTGSAGWNTDAVSLFFTGPATECIGPVPAYWEQPAAARYGYPAQYRAAGDDQTSLAERDLISTAIVEAQLTANISRDDSAQRQDAPRDEDAPMPDAPAVHDIATPRRMIGGRCRKCCISAQPTSDKRRCAACSMCGQQFSHGEPRLQQWCNRQTDKITTSMHTVLVEVLVTIMNCIQSKLWIKMQLMLSPANDKPSSGQQQTQRYFCPLHGVQLHLPMMSRTCLDVRRHSAWMKRS